MKNDLELSDYYKQKATKVLDVIVKENGWEHYSIVEDSSYFQNGLRVIGYDSEDAKLGLVDGGELGSECIDISCIEYDLVVSDKGLDCTLNEFLREYNIDNLADIKTKEFIDAQGLSKEVYASQHADASFAKPLKFNNHEVQQDELAYVLDVDDFNQNFNSREFEILSDGEEIPFDVQQSQIDRSFADKGKNKQKSNKKMNVQTNSYKKTEQWSQSRITKPSTQEERRAVLESKKLSPSASIELHTKKVAEKKSAGTKSKKQTHRTKRER